MDWLTSLVDIGANFINLTIEWEKGGSKMVLRGEILPFVKHKSL